MYIGIDVGGTNIRVASFDSLDNPQYIKIEKNPSTNNYNNDLNTIIRSIEIVSEDKPVLGIGIGLPGFINKNEAFACLLPNLSNWNCTTLYHDLTERYKCDVVLDNDAAAAALGEAFYGNGKYRDFLFFIWGTGIGGAEVNNIGGKIFLFPFEPGHQIIELNGRAHSCGQKGCLEAYCGGRSLQEIYQRHPKDLTDEQWDEVLNHMSHGIVNVLTIRPQELLIISGGIGIKESSRFEKLLDKIREQIRIYPPPKQIIVSQHGDDAGIIGAMCLLKKDYYESFNK